MFESPAKNFKNSFIGHIALFHTFPYLLPTIFAGALLVTGAILSCFLSWDGGVRGGSRIALSTEKDEPLAPQPEPPSPAPTQLTAVPTITNRRGLLSPAGELGEVPHARRDSRASLGTAYG